VKLSPYYTALPNFVHRLANAGVDGIVLFNRFLPGIRSVISIVSGISRLNTIKVVILSLVSASVWNLIWLQIGYLLGSNWDTVKEKISDIMAKYNLIVVVILAIIVIIYVITRIVKKRNAE